MLRVRLTVSARIALDHGGSAVGRPPGGFSPPLSEPRGGVHRPRPHGGIAVAGERSAERTKLVHCTGEKEVGRVAGDPYERDVHYFEKFGKMMRCILDLVWPTLVPA